VWRHRAGGPPDDLLGDAIELIRIFDIAWIG
jgi:hypothetical protein